MSSGQNHIVRLLRQVESRLGRRGQAAEASRVGKIMQKLAQTDDIHEELSTLYRVEGFSEFAVRLMWQLESVEQGAPVLENGAMDYYASVLGGLLVVAQPRNPEDTSPDMSIREEIDQMSVLLHEVGRMIEEIKRGSIESGVFKGIEESHLYKLLSELSLLGDQCVRAGRKDICHLVAACSGFIQYVVDNAIFRDVRVVNILDNTNLTLQTALETIGVEDHDALESTIQLLNQPKDLLD